MAQAGNGLSLPEVLPGRGGNGPEWGGGEFLFGKLRVLLDTS